MGPMERARRIVESHAARHGDIPQAQALIDYIATDLSFMQLSSVPHRDDVAEIKQQHAEMLAALKAIDKYLLVIESAVRNDAPRDSGPVMAALKAGVAAIAKAEDR